MRDLFLFAGETSGDLHGSRLIKALKKRGYFSSFRGVGGPLMRSEGLDCYLQMEAFQVMGFSDVFKALPSLYRNFYRIRDHILKTNPSCVVLIDYPGFNLRLAKALRKKGYQGKLVQYICPTVWAHGKGRAQTMIDTLDLLLTIFPFEAQLFDETSLNARYIGNPLAEYIRHHPYDTTWKKTLGIPDDKRLIAIFPGSRIGEIERHTKDQLLAASLVKQKHPEISFALSCAHDEAATLLRSQIQQSPLMLGKDIHLVPRQFSYELMQDCLAALAKSGTVTLELALHQKPTVVLYTVTRLNYFIAKYFMQLNLPHYCIVNILRQKEVFPELIGKKLEAQQLADHLNQLISHSNHYQHIQQECTYLKEHLGQSSPSNTACQAIEELFLC